MKVSGEKNSIKQITKKKRDLFWEPTTDEQGTYLQRSQTKDSALCQIMTEELD